MESDRDLERRFAAMRGQDEQHVPPFASVLAPRRLAARPVRARLALALAVAAVVAVGVWRLAAPNAPAVVIAFSPGEMRVPTDYLLDMVPYSRAGEIPRIGASDWFALPLTSDAITDTRRLP